jgi:hypothetical protein
MLTLFFYTKISKSIEKYQKKVIIIIRRRKNMFDKKEWGKEYRLKNKEKIQEYNRNYYLNNKEKQKEKQKERMHNYYLNNKEKTKKYNREYYLAHKEELAKKNREYIKNHRDLFVKSIMESKKRRVERLRAEGVSNAWNVVNYGHPKKYDPKIGLIDLETNDLIAIFNSYKECANYFGTTSDRIKRNIAKNHRKRFMGKWYKLIASDRNAS